MLVARRDAPAHVVGAASAEGVAIARLLVRLGFTRVVLHDSRPREGLRRAFRTTHGAWGRDGQEALWRELRPLLDDGCFGDDYLEGMADAGTGSLVALPQGWYLDADNRRRVVAAVPDGALVTSMVGLYFALHPGPVVGVTGTNGKSTTVALLDALFEAGGVDHRTAGNERSSRQFLPDVESGDPACWALLEVSNRQLLQLRRSPQVAAITALTPDHLDEHDGIDGYAQAKARLFAHQLPEDIAIACADDRRALTAAAGSAAQLVRCGVGDHPGSAVTWVGDELVACDVPRHRALPLAGRTVVARRSDLALPGLHNLRNAAVAVAAALACGVDPELVATALRGFGGASLRLERIGEVAGVEVWNDIKSTTPEATIAALQSLEGRRVQLVVGGHDKGLDYGPLARAIVAGGDSLAVHAVPGSATDALEACLDQAHVLARADDLDDALDAAFAGARPGDAVLVSPAAAGFWTSQLEGRATLRARVARRAEASTEVPHT